MPPTPASSVQMPLLAGTGGKLCAGSRPQPAAGVAAAPRVPHSLRMRTARLGQAAAVSLLTGRVGILITLSSSIRRCGGLWTVEAQAAALIIKAAVARSGAAAQRPADPAPPSKNHAWG